MNLKQKNKLANKTAIAIINLILKLNDEALINLFIIISNELKKRGIEDVRSCSDFLD